MCFGGGDDGAAAAAALRESQRQASITQGTVSIDQAFAGFDDEHFENLRQSFIDFADPQLADDAFEAKKNLNFALQRTGLSSSTAAGSEQARLAKQLNEARTGILSQADQFVRTSQADIERARAELLSQLQSTEDPAAAASGAVRRAQALTAPPSFTPLPRFVFDVGRGLERVSEQQGFEPLLRSGIFSQKKGGSQTIVGGG